MPNDGVRGPRARRAWQGRQEAQSLGQVIDVLSEWNVNRLSEDYGEDFFIQIFDDGVSTGVTFQAQVKSTRSLDTHKLAAKPVYSYSLDVEDLLHWEDSSPPVVFLLWDVEQQEGVWLDIPAAIQSLDSKEAAWRNQASVSIHIPSDNRLSRTQGMKALRRRIADWAFPAVSRGKTLEVSFSVSFPPTEEGLALAAKLQATVDRGDGVTTVPGEYVKDLVVSPWYKRLYGLHELHEPSLEVTIGAEPVSGEIELEFVAVALTRTATCRIPLHKVMGGWREVTFESDDGAPFYVSLVVTKNEGGGYTVRSHIRISTWAPTARHSLELSSFLLATQEAGGFEANLDGVCLLRAVASEIGLPAVSVLSWMEEVSRKLVFIERFTGRYGKFDLSNGVRSSDSDAIDKLAKMCAGEAWDSKANLSFSVAGASELPDSTGEPISLVVPAFDVWTILGVEIPLGRMRMTLSDPQAFYAALQEGVRSSGRVEITDTFRHELLDPVGQLPRVEKDDPAPDPTE